MPAFHAAPVTRFAATRGAALPIATKIVVGWLACGVLALILFPAARGTSVWFGSMPLWLVGMPLLELALLRWRRLLPFLRRAWPLTRRRASSSRRTRSRRRVVRTTRRVRWRNAFAAFVSP